MLNVSNDYITQMHKQVQVRRISGLIDGTIPFTEDDILQGSLVLTNQCMSNDSFGYGGVFIGELRLTFISRSLVSRKNWEKKKITISDGLYIETEDDYEYVSLGEFYVSEANHTTWGVEIVAYDAMSKFDVLYPALQSIGKPYGLALLACQQCNVPFGMEESDFNDVCLCPNDQLAWYEQYTETTWRDFLHYLGQACNIFFTINRDGELIAATIPKAYDSLAYPPNDERTVNERFDDGFFADFETKYTGIIATNITGDEDITTLYGSDNGVVIDIGVNPFLQTIANDDATNLIAQLTSDISQLETSITNVGDEISFIQDEIDAIDQEIHDHPEREAQLLPIKANLQMEKTAKENAKTELERQKTAIENQIIAIQQDLLARTLTLMGARLNVMVQALMQIKYTPSTISMLNDPCYELGDKIRYKGGIAGTECDLCVMRFDYTFGQKYTVTTFGENPSANGAKTKGEKSGRGSSNNPKININFAKFINADPITITEGIETQIGELEFLIVTEKEVEAWCELKMTVTPNSDGDAGIKLTYYLDGEEVATYYPEEEWRSGNSVSVAYDGVGLVMTITSGGASDSVKTINFHYHIPFVEAGRAHVWRVTATGLNGTEAIATGDAHIVLWAQGMLGDDAWMGLIPCADTFPLYEFGCLELLGTLSDSLTITQSAPEKIITEDDDYLVTEAGDNITTE